jgi:LacI family transcriptional regulator
MASAVGGIRSATEELGYRLILSQVIDAANPGALFQNREIDGAVVFVSSHFTHEIAESLRMLNEQLPVVRVMGGPLASNVDRVLPDNQRIGELAHEYLKECGCREVGYVTTSPGWSLMRIRGHAFLDAACDAGRPGRAFLLTPEPNVEWSYGRNVTAAQDVPGLVAKLAAAKPRLDGLFFANDRTTTEFFPLLVRAGMRPGHDLTIVSCDNEEVRLAALDPRPASIDSHAHEIGRRAVMQVIARIARPSDPPLCIYISPSLVRPGR